MNVAMTAIHAALMCHAGSRPPAQLHGALDAVRFQSSVSGADGGEHGVDGGAGQYSNAGAEMDEAEQAEVQKIISEIHGTGAHPACAYKALAVDVQLCISSAQPLPITPDEMIVVVLAQDQDIGRTPLLLPPLAALHTAMVCR
jgi:hypothetical protein